MADGIVTGIAGPQFRIGLFNGLVVFVSDFDIELFLEIRNRRFTDVFPQLYTFKTPAADTDAAPSVKARATALISVCFSDLDLHLILHHLLIHCDTDILRIGIP